MKWFLNINNYFHYLNETAAFEKKIKKNGRENEQMA